MENNIITIGSKSDLSQFKLLMRDFQNHFTCAAYSKNLFANLMTHNPVGVIIMANRRNIGSANRLLELIYSSNTKMPVVIISTIKDVDLLYYSLKINLVDFIVYENADNALKHEVEKSMFLINQNKVEKTILAIGAHPDDIEIGCGGTLLKHQKENHNINILTLSKGSVGGNQEKRANESKNAANHLNAQLFIHNLEDTKIAEGNPTIQVIQDAIKKVNPDIIYTHSNNDNHQDHRATHKATLVAARGIKHVYAYQAPSTNVSFLPRHFEIIDNYLTEKQRLINYHVSQTTDKGRSYLKPEVIQSTATYWGRFANYSYCEPFEVIKS